MSKNTELIEFAEPRIRLIIESLDTFAESGSPQIINTIAEIIKEANHNFTKILKRGTVSKFFLSTSDKKDIMQITRDLDQCLNVLGLGMQIRNNLAIQETVAKLHDFICQMDSLTIQVLGEERGLGMLLSNEPAKEFYLKFFIGQALIPVNCFVAAFKIQLKSEGYHWSEGLVGFIIKQVDDNQDGNVSLEEMNRFFENYWTNQEDKQITIAQDYNPEQIYGAIYHKNLYLTFIKCGQINFQEPLVVTPKGFQGGNENRVTTIGHGSEGVNSCDIILSPDDVGIGVYQAQILSKQDGYYLQEMASNGFTRIRIPKGKPMQLTENTILSFGWNQIVMIEQLGSQEQIANYVKDQEKEGTINMFQQAHQQVASNTLSGSTVAAAGFIQNDIHMAVRFLYGYFKGSCFTLDPKLQYKGFPEQKLGGFSIGKWKPKCRDLAFPREVGEISKDHGQFYFDTQNWFYKDMGSTNGSWWATSTYTNLASMEKSQKVQLSHGDEIMIGEYKLSCEIR